ncbi:hypothetical protein C8P68_10318 [Mucilaginibacter yixingensis]|uniref:Uncharacterized protein n=1 Tax=Mucilaginibacter yixingensis TaxID=1295612 RepID=A0A2T5JAN1_9SPHI|nr:hypothetical protein [Mucilaginibacter yixingensis]PTQ97859.1 hypothetical protein C8P68_10318 [Mucilaginibacter yixingensis]
MELGQIILLALGSFFVIIPAYLTYKKNEAERFRFNFLLCSIIGALISFISTCSSNRDSVKNSVKANYNDSLYKDLLKKNFDKATFIISNQNISLDSTKKVLTRSTDILKLQQSSINLLSKQIDTASQILSLNRAFDTVQRNIKTKTDKILKEATADNSFIIINRPYIEESDSTLVISIINTGTYQANVNVMYTDPLGSDGLIFKDIIVPGNGYRPFYQRSIKGQFNKTRFWFDVHWKNRRLLYSFNVTLFRQRTPLIIERDYDYSNDKSFFVDMPSKNIVYLKDKN